MSNLPKTYIQKMSTVTSTYDIEETFGFVTMDLPFQVSVDVKDIEQSDFLDEHGMVEPNMDTLYVKSYDMDVTFATKGSADEIYSNYVKFRDYLLGRDVSGLVGTGTQLMIYSDYSHIGRQYIRLKTLDDNAEYVDLGSEQYMLKIKTQFTVNDPLTDVYYHSSDGTLSTTKEYNE